MIDPYENLANGIILLAVKDWREAVRTLKKWSRDKDAKRTRDECEQFFRSEWFAVLTSVDGNALLNKLKQEEHVCDEQRISPAGLPA
ncbi:MAG: hypothetical protein II460_06335 [Oscillospiraceae bacterium]|nr:hypothetical protein [Oscillospiraceae bacterium]